MNTHYSNENIFLFPRMQFKTSLEDVLNELLLVYHKEKKHLCRLGYLSTNEENCREL